MRIDRRRKIIASAVAAAVVVGTGTGVALSTVERADDQAIRRAKALVKTARVVPAPTAAELTKVREFALGMAADAGDPSPTSIRVVPTTRHAANAIDTGATVNSDEDVFMVTMTGDFVLKNAGGPSTGFAPRGTVFTFTYDLSRDLMLDQSLGPIMPNLSQLGEVISLYP